ncbi:MAG: 50S ribosomal protein L6 [bacterium]
MSRIGKKPIEIPENVEVKIDKNFVVIKGSKGELRQEIKADIKIDKNQIIVKSDNPALWGLSRTLIANMVEGVQNGFSKQLEIVGTGYSAQIKDDKLVMKLGFSHPTELTIPKDIEIKVEKNIMTISGFDKQLVGQTAAKIRDIKKPEPYKGKGIRYVGEIVKIKPGKKAMGAES